MEAKAGSSQLPTEDPRGRTFLNSPVLAWKRDRWAVECTWFSEARLGGLVAALWFTVSIEVHCMVPCVWHRRGRGGV